MFRNIFSIIRPVISKNIIKNPIIIHSRKITYQYKWNEFINNSSYKLPLDKFRTVGFIEDNQYGADTLGGGFYLFETNSPLTGSQLQKILWTLPYAGKFSVPFEELKSLLEEHKYQIKNIRKCNVQQIREIKEIITGPTGNY